MDGNTPTFPMPDAQGRPLWEVAGLAGLHGETIRRGIQRMITGHAKVSGEMQVLIGLLKMRSTTL